MLCSGEESDENSTTSSSGDDSEGDDGDEESDEEEEGEEGEDEDVEEMQLGENDGDWLKVGNYRILHCFTMHFVLSLGSLGAYSVFSSNGS